MTNLCPICQKDDVVQRVATLVASGAFADSSGGHIDLNGTTSSNLTRSLAPPSEPVFDTGVLENIFGTVLLVFAIPLGVICSLIGGGNERCIIPLIIVFGFIAVLIIISGAKKKKLGDAQRPQAIAKWEKAKAHWERLYFCHRDGIVFDPENNKTCQPSQIREFVTSNTS